MNEMLKNEGLGLASGGLMYCVWNKEYNDFNLA